MQPMKSDLLPRRNICQSPNELKVLPSTRERLIKKIAETVKDNSRIHKIMSQ